jgi:hypothetical protein
MSETHRRVLLTHERLRVVGVFYELSNPLIVIESRSDADAMGKEQWKRVLEFDTNVKLDKTPVNVLLLELLFHYCMEDHERRQW